MAMPADTRFSRYHVTSEPPPRFKQFIRNLASSTAVRRHGFLKSKNDVRGLAASTDNIYGNDVGKADDLFRFLINNGILIEDDRGFWFDSARADHIVACCDVGRAPDPITTDALTKITRLEQKRLKAAPDAAQLPTDNPAFGGTLPSYNDQTMWRGDQQTTPKLTPADAGAQAGSTRAEEKRQPKYVLYLTPLEQDIWTMIRCSGETVQIFKNPQRLFSTWASSSLSCTAEEYALAVSKFVERGILQLKGEDEESRYFIPHKLSDYLVVEIEERSLVRIAPEHFNVLNAIQQGEFDCEEPPLWPAFDRWIKRHFPNVNPDTAKSKFLGFRPSHDSMGWGVIQYPEMKYVARGIKGFESKRFEVVKEAPATQLPPALDPLFRIIPTSDELHRMPPDELFKTRGIAQRMIEAFSELQANIAAEEKRRQAIQLRQELEALAKAEEAHKAQQEALQQEQARLAAMQHECTARMEKLRADLEGLKKK